MTATHSFCELLASKGWSPPVKTQTAVAAASPEPIVRQQKKAANMLDLFAHRSTRLRSSSCTVDEDIATSGCSTASTTSTMSSLSAARSTRRHHHQPASATAASASAGAHAKSALKKCASAGAASSKTVGGWGMVPVLNELEQHSSFYHNPMRARRESQCVCENCGRLFFKHLSGVDAADFCSLDCQASHAYSHDVQDAIDTQLALSDDSADSGESDWSSASSCSVVSFSS